MAFALLYLSYSLSLVVKRNYAFWKDDMVLEGLATPLAVGSLGALYESASGVSKVAGSVLVDLVSPTLLLSASLAAQGLSCVLLLGLLPLVPFPVAAWAWGLNGFVQSFSWPALTRIFMAWFPVPEERGMWYGLLGTCQNAGAALAPLLTQAAAAAYGWRARLLLPGALAVLFSVVLLACLRASPPSPPPSPKLPAAGQEAAASRKEAALLQPPAQQLAAAPHRPAELKATPLSLPALLMAIFTSQAQWLLCLNYFFNSVVRNAVTTFVRTLLVTRLGHAPAMAAAGNFAFELGGALGGLAAGAISDKAFGGRRGPVMLLCGLALVPLPLALPHLASASASTVSGLYFALGLAAFPPHVLNGLMSRELAPPAIQSSAGGWTKCWGQAGASLADWWVPALVASLGWERVAQGMAAAAAVSALAMVPLWSVGGGMGGVKKA